MVRNCVTQTSLFRSPTKRRAVDDKLSSTIKKLRSWDNIISSSKAHIQEKLSRKKTTDEKVVSSNLVNTTKETKEKRFSDMTPEEKKMYFRERKRDNRDTKKMRNCIQKGQRAP